MVHGDHRIGLIPWGWLLKWLVGRKAREQISSQWLDFSPGHLDLWLADLF
jgi:hypothetical protein